MSGRSSLTPHCWTTQIGVAGEGANQYSFASPVGLSACKTVVPELWSVFCPTFHVSGTASYADDVTLVFISMLTVRSSTGTAFGAQPATRTSASRMLMNAVIHELSLDVIVLISHALQQGLHRTSGMDRNPVSSAVSAPYRCGIAVEIIPFTSSVARRQCLDRSLCKSVQDTRDSDAHIWTSVIPVSYTHLTLPTNRKV